MGSITLATGDTYVADNASGTVTEVTSGNTDRITVANGTTTPVISAPDTPVYVGITLTNGTVATTPSNATDIANKLYVDNAVSGGGLGTVLSFSFNDANGFTGTVTNPTSTPELTLSFDSSGFVPYTGATSNVDLDDNALIANSVYVQQVDPESTIATYHAYVGESLEVGRIEWEKNPSGNDSSIFALVSDSGGSLFQVWHANASAVYFDTNVNISTLSASQLVGTDGSKNIVNYNLVEGSGISISQVGTDITISSTLPSLVWNDISTTSQAITAGNGYVSHSASQTTFTLPTTAAFGSTFSILYLAPSSGQLLQNAAQTIIAGDQQTTSGTSGRLENIDYGDVLTVLCTLANTEFMVISPIGNFNVV